ncbi:hypothetical protein FGADI_2533 [Fusarium gaditjirri]|uniref:Cytochrome P450 monooxygenase n=1 Tax=Fusarium gaditjirri TaxID=282569 RepID=A0A8H4X1F3_9HYPO|nr:hypothetical protein FGADI_2533 [Fusarium gaditjirri]
MSEVFNWLTFDIIESDNLDLVHLSEQSKLLMITGSGTTANLLAATTHYLLKNPDKLANLQAEVRSAISSRDEITGDAVAHLPYLDGVIEEERWVGEGFGDRKEASKPFSLGPRGCLGINLAYMEAGVTMASLVWKYDLGLVNQDLDWLADIRLHLIWEKPKLMVRYYPRDKIATT